MINSVCYLSICCFNGLMGLNKVQTDTQRGLDKTDYFVYLEPIDMLWL